MKILYVARRYWPAIGGVESFVRYMATELAADHDMTVLAARIDNGEHTRLSDSLLPPVPFDPFRDGQAAIKPLTVPVWRRPPMLPLLAHVTPGLARYAYGRTRPTAAALVARSVAPVIAREARGADVIHMWAGDLLASAVIRAGALARVPVVITPFAHQGQWGYDRASVLAYQRADRVAALLECEAAFYNGLGVDQRRIEIAGVCSPGVAAVARDEARRRLGVSGKIVLFLGARRPYKGFDLLLKAAPHVATVHPDTTFAFVGPGEKLSNVAAGSRVLDVGAVEEHEKALWLSAADLLCLPSQAEILPVSILEAWSAGTPVLTSDIPALTELVGRAGGGRCVERSAAALAGGLIEMLSDPDQLRTFGTLGQQTWRTRYTPGVVASRHEAMYARARLGPEATVGTWSSLRGSRARVSAEHV